MPDPISPFIHVSSPIHSSPIHILRLHSFGGGSTIALLEVGGEDALLTLKRKTRFCLSAPNPADSKSVT